MHVNGLTFFVVLGLVIWWYKPLRQFLIQRTNRTVKVLLVVLPALFIGRVAYGLYQGERDESLVAAAIVIVLAALWGVLVWLNNDRERRRPTQAQGPDWAALSRLPGMPRLPQVPGVTGPAGVPGMSGAITPANVQRAAEMAQTAAPQLQRAAQAAAPHVQRAARTAVQTAAEVAADFDRNNVSGSVGRSSGRLYAKLRRSMRESAGTAPAPQRQ